MGLKSRYLFDWLSFTVRSGNPKEVITELGLDKLNFEPMKNGKYGYTHGYTVDGLVNVLYSPFRTDMGVHVEMTGQGVRKYETLMELSGKTWLEILDEWKKFSKFSRIDIALDDFLGLVSFDDIVDSINKGFHVGVFRSFKVISGRDSNGKHRGTTIYMGSNKSNVMLRVYEKNYERQVKGYEVTSEIWNRWELVLKHDKANSFVEEFVNTGSFGIVFKGLLANFIRFVDYSNDKNKSRWKNSVWWDEFLGDCIEIELSKVEYQPSLAKTINWFETSALSSLKGLYDIAKTKNLDFLDILSDSNSWNDEKSKKMMEEFESLSDGQKSKILGLMQRIGERKKES